MSVEARDLFWGMLSGTTVSILLRSLLSILLVWSLILLAFALESSFLREELSACHKPLPLTGKQYCYLDAYLFLKLFVPFLIAVFTGSFISTFCCQAKRFQISAMSTVLMLLSSIVCVENSFVLPSYASGFLGAGVFFFMYGGYRLVFFVEERLSK